MVVCGSENEVAPVPELSGDYFAAQNRKLDSGEIRYNSQKKTTWAEVVLNAPDQLCQKNAWALMKIFATSTATNKDEQNSETNIQVLDNFVNACMSTYKDVIKRASFNEEMSRQLTYDNNKAVARGWHLVDSLAYPDENYARELLQLHTIGTIKLYENGTAVLDQFGRRIANYDQSNIFESSKIWTAFQTSTRRGNYEDLDWSGGEFYHHCALAICKVYTSCELLFLMRIPFMVSYENEHILCTFSYNSPLCSIYIYTRELPRPINAK